MHIDWHIKLDINFRPKHKQFTEKSWGRLRDIVKIRDGELCYYCGKHAPDGQLDHKIPLSRGGDDSMDNLVWACAWCNSEKGKKTPEEYIQSLDGESVSVLAAVGSESVLLRMASMIRHGECRLSRRGIAEVSGIGSDRARTVLQALEAAGALCYPNGRNHPNGAQLTSSGEEMLDAWLEQLPSPAVEVGG